MNFNLTRPCANCPFRTEPRFYLGRERAEGIAELLMDDHSTFHCHETIDYSKVNGEDRLPDGCGIGDRDTEHCAGAAIILQKIGRPNSGMRLARMAGPKPLDLTAPVYDNFEEFIKSVGFGL